jgi:DNA primase
MAMAKDRLAGKKTLNVGGLLDEFEKDDIRKKVDIVKLFKYFGAKPIKKGNNWVARCIFGKHEDKTPSLFIESKKGLYNCFGCEHAGDHFTLVMTMKGCGFKEALQFLKEMAGNTRSAAPTGIEQKTDTTRQVEKPPDPEEPAGSGTVDITYRDIADYYHKKLYNNKKAIAYLKKRGFTTPELYARFKIGYVDGTLPSMLSTNQKKALTQMHILNDRGTERFYKRIVFPLYDGQSRIINFYGRSITDD